MNDKCFGEICATCMYYTDRTCENKHFEPATKEMLIERLENPYLKGFHSNIKEFITTQYDSKFKQITDKDAIDFLDSVKEIKDIKYDQYNFDIVNKYEKAANDAIKYLQSEGILAIQTGSAIKREAQRMALEIINTCICTGNYEFIAVDPTQKDDDDDDIAEETKKERFVHVCTDEEEGFHIADNTFTFTFDLSKSSMLHNSVIDMMNYYFKNLRWEYERFNRMILDTKFIADTYWNSSPDDEVVNSWGPMLRSISLDTNEYEIRFRYDQQTYQFQFNKDTYSIIIIFRRVNNLPISDIMNLAYGRTTVEDAIKKNETDTEENIKDGENTGLVLINPKIVATKKYYYLINDIELKENKPEVYKYFVKILKKYTESKNIYIDDLEKFILGMKQFIKDEPAYRLNPKINYINFKASSSDVIFQFFCPELSNYVSIRIIFYRTTLKDILLKRI